MGLITWLVHLSGREGEGAATYSAGMLAGPLLASTCCNWKTWLAVMAS